MTRGSTRSLHMSKRVTVAATASPSFAVASECPSGRIAGRAESCREHSDSMAARAAGAGSLLGPRDAAAREQAAEVRTATTAERSASPTCNRSGRTWVAGLADDPDPVARRRVAVMARQRHPNTARDILTRHANCPVSANRIRSHRSLSVTAFCLIKVCPGIVPGLSVLSGVGAVWVLCIGMPDLGCLSWRRSVASQQIAGMERG